MSDPQQILAMRQVVRYFGDLAALNEADVTLNAGEVHAVIGENGAGKSTLMKILAGHLAASSGAMRLQDREVDISKPASGERRLVGFVEQEGGLIPELSGAENLILAEGLGFWNCRRRAGARLIELGRRFHAEIDPFVPVQSLPMGQRQRLEIAITLARGASILILDEPTATLSIDDAKALGETIRTFVGSGGAVFYISHKLNEVMEIADRITVMRRGRVVGRHKPEETSVAELAAEMVGELPGFGEGKGRAASDAGQDLIDVAMGVREEARFSGARRDVCVVDNVSAKSSYRSESDLRGLSLSVRSGEVVGVAGVVGSGQTLLAEVLAGLVPPESGEVRFEPGPIAYVPENRHRDALALALSVSDNLIVHMHRRSECSTGPWLRKGELQRCIDATLASSNVHGADSETPVGKLSGGNQQKLVLGRELEQQPTLLVAHNPFRGLDVRAIHDIKETITGACRAGCGVVMISSDLDELFQLAHRIVVMFEGRIVGGVDVGAEGLEKIGRLLGGVANELVH